MRALFGAIDIGASSGRVMAGLFQDGKISLSEVHRFPNAPIKQDGYLVWDYPKLLSEIKRGLRELGARAEKLALSVTSIGIDTWAVDFGLLRQGELLQNPYSYREPANDVGVRSVHKRISFAELYAANGIQFLPFNSLYQIERIRKLNPDLLASADRLLLLPDLIGYSLTGKMATERTNASSTGLLNVQTRNWDERLIELLGMSSECLAPLRDAGDELGFLKSDFGPRLLGTKVVLVGSHDTASAVVGVPATKPNFVFLSSGTWSLLGTELEHAVLSANSRHANFTNELGVDGTVRYLKNLSGLWLVSESLRDYEIQGTRLDLADLLEAAEDLRPVQVIDVTDSSLTEPGDIVSKISRQLESSGQPGPKSAAELVAIILHSLAKSYAENLRVLESLTGQKFDTLHVIGGGSQNQLLNRLTAEYAGIRVVSGPVEATAIGNLLIQIRSAGLVSGNLFELRELIIRSQLV